ncbi:hypothetical protein J4Q44_G00246620 [Coregonus suidteri]|uniref:Uncharacterized protein n=1 Tax=Coregonus suidteri TaxID=861788 RepID=A0AAN8LI31_9TELE
MRSTRRVPWRVMVQRSRSGTVSSTTGPLVVGEAAWGTESVLGPTSAYRGMVTERRGSSTLRSGTPSPMGPWRSSRLKRLEVAV